MSRKHLYKAKRISKSEWVEGYFAASPKGDGIVYEILDKCRNPVDSDPMWQKILITCEVDVFTVCEYTGKSIGDDKIFERDILHDTEKGELAVVYWDEKRAGFMLAIYAITGKMTENGWDEYAGGLSVVNVKSFNDYTSLERFKIVGNTIDNSLEDIYYNREGEEKSDN